MTDLDKALQAFEEDRNHPGAQSEFYNLFLNSTFLVPTLPDESVSAEAGAEGAQAVPFIVEAEGNDFLMLFDSEDKLRSWAQTEVDFVEVAGHAIAALSEPPLHWALNIGCEASKLFHPEEIAYLKEIVDQCRAQAEKEDK